MYFIKYVLINCFYKKAEIKKSQCSLKKIKSYLMFTMSLND